MVYDQSSHRVSKNMSLCINKKYRDKGSPHFGVEGKNTLEPGASSKLLNKDVLQLNIETTPLVFNPLLDYSTFAFTEAFNSKLLSLALRLGKNISQVKCNQIFVLVRRENRSTRGKAV